MCCRPSSGSRTDRPAYAPATMSQKMSRLYNKAQSLNSLPTSWILDKSWNPTHFFIRSILDSLRCEQRIIMCINVNCEWSVSGSHVWSWLWMTLNLCVTLELYRLHIWPWRDIDSVFCHRCILLLLAETSHEYRIYIINNHISDYIFNEYSDLNFAWCKNWYMKNSD